MKKYISPDLEFVVLLAYENILTGSGETPEKFDDSELDSDELFN